MYWMVSKWVSIFKTSEKKQEMLTDQSDCSLVVLNVLFQVTGERLRDLKVCTWSMMLINVAKNEL